MAGSSRNEDLQRIGLRVSFSFWGARILSALALAPAAGCDSTVDSTPKEAAFPCDEPQPLVAAGADSGYVMCAGGWMHRAEVTACASAIPRAGACVSDPATPGQCAMDGECVDQPNGYCNADPWGGGCYCNYGCTTDADCGEGRICLCGDPVGACVTANCTSDADCGGRLCTSYVVEPGCGGTGFACQTGLDECASDADCPAGAQCTLQGIIRVCEEPTCAIGRPFLIDGTPRVAEAEARGDWRADRDGPRLDHLDEITREALSMHWTRAGLMEHASIAAFARFALELLSLGAPPGLLRDTQAAMADETEHARLCFALASAYGERDVGPGRLSMDGALGGGDAATILVTAIREGCIGETVAAIEAAEAALHAEDPAVRRALDTIAADETRHAELAWRFIAWAVEHDPGLREIAAAELEAAVAEAGAPAPRISGGADLLRFGVVGEPLRREIRRRALSEVVGPCARALLAADAPRPRRARAAA